MIAASRQLDPADPSSSAVGIYMSLRHAPLLKSTGEKYGRILCEIVVREVKRALGIRAKDFDPTPDVESVQAALMALAAKLGKRIVLYFDDAAHLGREASLEEFFDIYRMFSSSSVSCKASIYPGVTRFGVRFDVYNDATVIDLLRSEEIPDFAESFLEVLEARYGDEFGDKRFSSSLDKLNVASFLAQACLGNMRGFIFACNALQQRCSDGRSIGLTELGETLIELAGNYYWPLLDEIRPKLGMYTPMVDIARDVAELIFVECGQKFDSPRDALIHRDVDERLAKPLQILEYAGFVSRREASRALKSGGRGARYALNLCSLLESSVKPRLTRRLFESWMLDGRVEAVQFSKGSKLSEISVPATPDVEELAIFFEGLDRLKKSQAYPYGLTDQKIEALKAHGFLTVGDLVDASDEDLDEVPSVGKAMIKKVRNVLGQAIWM
ncbi:hypothetical protein OVA13_05815 [Pseudoxanthomonas sp. SL93]|uniref:hypothetical protein n=1 Tax=Pseudoxanthomonas sp. SL93 TaxID=2995142 RepID=UPI002271CC57|nr:hypothetical protein [Pseudoxanthomonas sp. SL93]WAC64291.1 hypothetical protein OVA13_05815 [Pseudoxanthomonas sp. SL93]